MVPSLFLLISCSYKIYALMEGCLVAFCSSKLLPPSPISTNLSWHVVSLASLVWQPCGLGPLVFTSTSLLGLFGDRDDPDRSVRFGGSSPACQAFPYHHRFYLLYCYCLHASASFPQIWIGFSWFSSLPLLPLLTGQ